MSNYTPYYEGGWKNEEEMTTTPICAEALNHMEEGISAAYDTDIGLYPTETASGDVAVIHDGAESVPVRDLSVEIDPVQSFNGYDKAWAGGAGKNLLPIDTYSSEANGITFTKNADGTIKATGTATANAQARYRGAILPAGNYKFNGCPAGGDSNTYHVYAWDYTTGARPTRWDGTTGSANDVGTGFQEIKVLGGHDVAIVCRVLTGVTVSNIVFKPMIVKADETDTTFEPYSNICPISGWDAVKVARTAQNLLPVTATTTTLYGVTFTVDDRGVVTAVGTSTSGNRSVLDYGHAYLRPGTYILSGCPAGGTDETYRLRLGIGSYAGDALTVERGGGREFTITEPMDLYARIYVQPAAGAVNQTWLPMIHLADEGQATWNSSEAEVTDVTLPTTVYGGTLDVTTGILTVDRATATFDGSSDEIWAGANTRFSVPLPGAESTGSGRGEVLSNEFVYSASATTSGTIFLLKSEGKAYVYPPVSDTLANFKAWLAEHPLQVVYPLATPQTYTLTPVQVKTLLGENRIYASAGQVTVRYRGEIKQIGVDPTLSVAGMAADAKAVGDALAQIEPGGGGGGGSVTVDTALSSTSTNPVQNKAIYAGIQAVKTVATTSANGLMSSTDKGRVDTLWADYQSALTALG